MVAAVLWYLITTLLGWVSFPLAYRFLPQLTDRGYAFSRTLGLLLWAYITWLLVSFGVLRNETGSLLLALALLLIACWIAFRSRFFRGRGIELQRLQEWWRSEKSTVITVELLFLASFAFMAIVRSANPEILGTEKPMELAFINAINQSAEFPPHDPWLSGYAISYYYFGYVMVGMFSKLTGVPGSIAFNLGITLVFALSSIGAYGVVYNMLRLRSRANENLAPVLSGRVPEENNSSGFLPVKTIRLVALLGPFFVLIISNLEGFLHSLHSRGLFSAGFWEWLDIKDLNLPPTEPFSWVPDNFWWWWRASRVLQDYDLAGNAREIINEFPFFSYLLADLHPHVLAMPFTILVMGLALNIYLGGGSGKINWLRLRLNVRSAAWLTVLIFTSSLLMIGIGARTLSERLATVGLAGLLAGGIGIWLLSAPINQHGWRIFTKRDLGTICLGSEYQISWMSFLLTGIIVGGMAFLNTWDFPIAVVLFAGAYILGMAHQRFESPFNLRYFQELILLGLALGLTGVILYLPFYIGFSSQAGGPVPNLIYVTRGAHLWVMFAPLLLPCLALLFYLVSRKSYNPGWSRSSRDGSTSGWNLVKKGLQLALWVLLGLWGASMILGLLVSMLPGSRELYLGSLGATESGSQLLGDGINLIWEGLIRRLTSPGAWLTLGTLLVLALGVLARPGNHKPDSSGETQVTHTANDFATLLILVGTLLVLVPEFFYLRDQFGWRMNTIFKFYFQAWLIWGIAAAYSTIILARSLRSLWGVAFRLSIILVILMGLAYPVLSLWNKTNGFQPAGGWTLDGTDYLRQGASADEMAAVEWLVTVPMGVIAEAVSPTGGSYTNYARIATLTGYPAVLGWMGHESQWRGGGEEMGSRQTDLERLYCTRDAQEARAILEKYNIRFVILSGLERSTYQPTPSCPSGLFEAKFDRLLSKVFQSGQITIYEVPQLYQVE